MKQTNFCTAWVSVSVASVVWCCWFSFARWSHFSFQLPCLLLLGLLGLGFGTLRNLSYNLFKLQREFRFISQFYIFCAVSVVQIFVPHPPTLIWLDLGSRGDHHLWHWIGTSLFICLMYNRISGTFCPRPRFKDVFTMKDTWKRFRTMVAVRSQKSFTAVPSPPDKKGVERFRVRSLVCSSVCRCPVLMFSHVSWFSLRVYRDRALV